MHIIYNKIYVILIINILYIKIILNIFSRFVVERKKGKMKKPISENINRSPRHEKIIKSPRHKTPNHNNSSSHQCYTDIYKYGIILSVILALAAIWLSITLHHFTTSTTKQMNNDIPSMNDNDSTLLKIRNDLKKAKGIIHDDDSDDVVDDNNNKLPQPSQQFHIVFSTGCSAYQDCKFERQSKRFVKN